MRFIWDENKNRTNRAKHGISFETALQAFADPFALAIPDRILEGEERWHTIGMIAGQMVVLIVHTDSERESEEIIRIISARKATHRERKAYEENYEENAE